MKNDRQYQAPKLDRFGTMSELSAGGSGGAPEFGNMMMRMMQLMMQRP